MSETTLASAGEYHVLPVADLQPSPTNPRKHFDTPDWPDFVASIRAHGVMQPILARPWPEGRAGRQVGTLYEIVAGERRYRGTLAAGLQTLPVMVRDLSDREVLTLQIIENLQRRNISELEEAEGYQRMIADLGYSADQLAEEVGKSRAYIYARLKLCDLTPEARGPLLDGTVPASVALLVARIPTPALQCRAMREVATGWHIHGATGEPMSARAALRHIQERYTLHIKAADWPLDDSDITDAPACDGCPSRTSCNRELFPDISADVCTDPDCYEAKRKAWPTVRLTRLQDDGHRVITWDNGGSSIAPLGHIGHQGHLPEDQRLINVDDYASDNEDDYATIREVLGTHLGTVRRTYVQTPARKPLECITRAQLADLYTLIGYTPTQAPSLPEPEPEPEPAAAEAPATPAAQQATATSSTPEPSAKERRAQIDAELQAKYQEAMANEQALERLQSQMLSQLASLQPNWGAHRASTHIIRTLLCEITAARFGEPHQHTPANSADTAEDNMVHIATLIMRLAWHACASVPLRQTLESLVETTAAELIAAPALPDKTPLPPTQAAQAAGSKAPKIKAAAKPKTTPAATQAARAAKPKAKATKQAAGAASKTQAKAKESGRAAAGGKGKTLVAKGKEITNPPIKYRSPTGHTWTGRGRKPQWVAEHLAGGGQLAEIEVTA